MEWPIKKEAQIFAKVAPEVATRHFIDGRFFDGHIFDGHIIDH